LASFVTLKARIKDRAKAIMTISGLASCARRDERDRSGPHPSVLARS
jgi:hypothetical protein